MTALRVGLDLDGVLHDFGGSFLEYMHSIGRPLSWGQGRDEPHTWNFFKRWGMTQEEFVEHCHNGVDAGIIFRNHVRPGAVEAVQEIKDMGHKVIVITDRNFGHPPEKSRTVTRKWWRDSGFPPYDKIIFSRDKTVVRTDLFIEDKLENYDCLVTEGTDCYLVTRSWNERKRCNRKRLESIAEFPAMVAKFSVDQECMV